MLEAVAAKGRSYIAVLVLAAVIALAGCERSEFSAPDMQGPAAMVRDGAQSRLWMLGKVEEKRMRSFGGGRRSTSSWVTDTYYHFEVEAIDPATTKTAWKQRIATYGDPKAANTNGPSLVIGHAEEGRLLGQDGDLVWLLIGDQPYALSAGDGHVVIDGPGIEAANPSLKGLLPSEARLYGFDQGLVFMSADARQFVVRGPKHEAIAYTPPASQQPQVMKLKPNGMPEIIPMRPPMGEVPARQATLGGAWLGLYSPKEAQDVLDDSSGYALRFPYTILDEGSTARRTFLRGKTFEDSRFDEKITRIGELTPIEGAPTFLKGRFLKRPGTDDAVLLDDPAGLLVWHSTRMDDAGRLALARVDAKLRTVWDSELPLSETDAVRRIASWQLPGRVVIVGELATVDDGLVHHRDPYLVSVDLAKGTVTSRQLNARE